MHETKFFFFILNVSIIYANRVNNWMDRIYSSLLITHKTIYKL